MRQGFDCLGAFLGLAAQVNRCRVVRLQQYGIWSVKEKKKKLALAE